MSTKPAQAHRRPTMTQCRYKDNRTSQAWQYKERSPVAFPCISQRNLAIATVGYSPCLSALQCKQTTQQKSTETLQFMLPYKIKFSPFIFQLILRFCRVGVSTTFLDLMYKYSLAHFRACMKGDQGQHQAEKIYKLTPISCVCVVFQRLDSPVHQSYLGQIDCQVGITLVKDLLKIS